MKKLFLGWLVALCCMNVFAEISVTDFSGREVTLAKPAHRIIALAPHIVENLYSAGVGDRIVGAVDYCDYPEAAKDIPRVGAISSFSLEAILALKPDLVVVWRSGRGGKIMEKLIRMGINVYASDPRSLSDIPKSIRDYGVLTGNQSVAEEAAKQFEAQYTELKHQYAEKSQVTVFYQVWNDPIQTLNGKHIISDVITLCGGKNVFSDEPALAPKVSVESILQTDPKAIIASGMGEERPEWLDMWKKWKQLQSVQCDNLFYVHPDLIQRHTMRILQGAETICRSLDIARKRTDCL
ncbi:cobalamin-binding protein [Teredinibacter sp. KSP-S5-2]|uniref:cobalamin-binding protein n=1 Tax=Teredinibacter sp. KSP-S5-2 TaxID=3034506 RepID=UPI002934438D|nr:cobalamin-binding protein [Teredinibacter sp. KSP-S5-2]WNO08366.1 cobalamin-binding protein [Teredinibacter sp. KSP-S5-2]